RHAAVTAVNRIGRAEAGAWGDIVEGLSSVRPRVRAGTLLAIRETYEPALIVALARFAERAALPGDVRATAYRALFGLHRMPPEWDGLWWRLGPLGFLEDARDGAAPPPRTREWAGTSAVTAALHAALGDSDVHVRRAAVANATLAIDRGTVDR